MAYVCFPLNQAAAGTTVVAAAVPGQRHKVLCLTLSLANDGTVQFLSGAAPLSGAIKVDGQLQPLVIGPAAIPFMETALGVALSIVTTQAAQGFVTYFTEP